MPFYALYNYIVLPFENRCIAIVLLLYAYARASQVKFSAYFFQMLLLGWFNKRDGAISIF